ncbi:hypothetical protein [Evansella clarkii]|uniref:hypothetical protein n=1 Tax=Evansella clarkii TaxID=79879 RepID=UPI000B44FC44|nr:hypothetical protein [Evansella clarkii]
MEEQHVLKDEVVIRFEQSLTEVTWGGLVVKSINNNLDGIVAISIIEQLLKTKRKEKIKVRDQYFYH